MEVGHRQGQRLETDSRAFRQQGIANVGIPVRWRAGFNLQDPKPYLGGDGAQSGEGQGDPVSGLSDESKAFKEANEECKRGISHIGVSGGDWGTGRGRGSRLTAGQQRNSTNSYSPDPRSTLTG